MLQLLPAFRLKIQDELVQFVKKQSYSLPNAFKSISCTILFNIAVVDWKK